MFLNICPYLDVDEYMSLFEYIQVWKKRFSISLGMQKKKRVKVTFGFGFFGM